MASYFKDKDMKTIFAIVAVILGGLAIALALTMFIEVLPKETGPKPSNLLRFQPVCEDSDPDDIRIAQAELCRHGIDCKIDGDFGKQTAFGMCELLVKIQGGYKVHKYYERNPNDIDERTN